MSRKFAILLPILITGVILDQASKLLVVRYLSLGAQIPVLEGFFNLAHARNRGAAFGLLSSFSPHFAWVFFLITTTVVILVVGYLWWRLPPRHDAAALGYTFILTGAVGNLIDRARLGEVIDFLDFHVGRHHWPAFNVADSLVCLGAAFLAWVILTEKEEQNVSRII